MKTDILFYQIFQNFPQIFFELIGETNIAPNSYEFSSPEIKQTAFRLDGVFLPTSTNSNLPLYFVEVQFQKKDNFYSRLFTEIFLYFYQQELDTEWYAIVIYPNRATEASASRQYRDLVQNRLRCIYLDEIEESEPQQISLGIIKLVIEPTERTSEVAKELIALAREESIGLVNRQEIVDLIETIVIYKFPHLNREEIETMLGLSQLKETKVYQEAVLEGRQEGKLEAKLEMIPLLAELGLNAEQISQRLEIDLETVNQRISS